MLVLFTKLEKLKKKKKKFTVGELPFNETFSGGLQFLSPAKPITWKREKEKVL